MSEELSHIDEQGRAKMVNVGAKDPTQRRAIAGTQFNFLWGWQAWYWGRFAQAGWVSQ